jgi:hypothetical protein
MSRRLLPLVPLFLLLLLTQAVVAQESDLAGRIEQGEQLSPEEMLRFMEAGLQEMQLGVTAVGKMLEVAEREKEIIKVQCLSNKLTQLRAFSGVGETIQQHVKDSLAENNPEQSSFHLRQFVVLISRFRELRAQADACVGPGSGTQAGSVVVEVSESGVGVTDETDGFDFDGDFGEAPPPTSQFQ